jgi:TolB-like protein/Tfp pilus assembly protein PilF
LPAPGRRTGGLAPSRARGAWGWLRPLLAAAGGGGWVLWPRPPAPSPPPPTPAASAVAVAERSIAVLPLANASNDPAQQFFSDGLSESLINALTQVDGLRVVGRISAFRFRDSRDDSATIGRKLGVAYLLNGSVQHAGDVVRISTSLTRAADGSSVWAEHYDRPYKDLFALQDEIASAVARALRPKLLPARSRRVPGDRPPGGDVAAYSAYLQGLKHWHDQDFPRAAEAMARAVQLDPGYAMAWALLSGSWSTVAVFWNQPPARAREQMRKARLAADRALRLAPGLGPAHAARAYLLSYGFDAAGAVAECRRALRLAPDDPTVLNGCGYVLAGAGHIGEALRLRERLLSIEPLYVANHAEYGELLLASGRLDEAAKYLRIAQGLSPPGPPPYQLMFVAIARGDAQAALEVARAQPSPWREMNLAIALQLSPDRARADAALAQVIDRKTWADTSPYLVAQAYALRGDPTATIAWLERAPPRDLLFLLADPLILRFRDDPRLAAFCAKVGLPDPATSEALGLDRIRARLAAAR